MSKRPEAITKRILSPMKIGTKRVSVGEIVNDRNPQKAADRHRQAQEWAQ